MTSKRTNEFSPWDRSCCAPSMTCHPEKLDQVEVMGSERIQLKLFSHASIKVVGRTHHFGESRRQVWTVAAPLLADAFERALQRRVDYLRGLIFVRHRAGNQHRAGHHAQQAPGPLLSGAGRPFHQ
jgi:hypothetical protein